LLQTIILPIVFVISVYCGYIFSRQKADVSALGVLCDDFPDKEVCSLACAIGWKTYCKLHGHYDDSGWQACVGDVIAWVIDDKSTGSYRFDGLYFTGNGIEACKSN